MGERTAGQHDSAGQMRTERLAEVDGAVGWIAEQLDGERPETAGHVRLAFDGLRTGLLHPA